MSLKYMKLVVGVCASLTFNGAVCASETDSSSVLDDDFGDDFGFEIDLGSDDDELNSLGTEDETQGGEAPASARSGWSFDGRFTYQQELSYNSTSPAAVETNRSSLQLEWNKNLSDFVYVHTDAKYNIYWDNDNRVDPDESMDDSWNIRNVYIQKTWGDMSAALGYQIIIFGVSETSVVADVFSPRNQSDFIFTSLEESRLSQLMLKVDQYSKLGHFTFIFNPYPQVDENPFSEVLPAGFVREDSDLDLDPEYAIRWKKVIGRADYSIFVADLADNNVLFQFLDNVEGGVLVDGRYNRYYMVAAASNYTFGNTSIQAEIAYNIGKSFQTAGPYSAGNNGIFESDQTKLGISINHSQNSVRNWLFGISKPYVVDENLFFSKSENEATDIVFGVSETFFHDTFDVNYTLFYDFENDTEVHRFATDYSFTDNLNLGLSAFYYDSIFGSEEGKQSSFLAKMRYSF